MVTPSSSFNLRRLSKIVARNEVDYRQPVHLTDVVEAFAWCSAIGTKSYELRFAVKRTGERPGIGAEGSSVMVCYDYKGERSSELPAAGRTAV